MTRQSKSRRGAGRSAGNGGRTRTTEVPVQRGPASGAAERARDAGREAARRAQELLPSAREAGQMARGFARDMNRTLQDWLQSPWRMPFAGWPAIEMFDRDGRLVVRAELPGVEKDDVRVRIAGDSLVIEGERRSESENQERGFYQSEWSYGHFSRRIPLPERVDQDDVRATFRDGVLEVSLRMDRTSSREIPIQGG